MASGPDAALGSELLGLPPDAIQSLPLLVVAYDADFRVVAWNAECERVTGYCGAEVVGRANLLELLCPEAEPRCRLSHELTANGGPHSFLTELTAKSGLRRRVCWTTMPVPPERASGPRCVLGIDVTELHCTDDDYRLALDTAVDGYAVIDVHGRYLDVNDSYCRFLGYARDELLQMTVADVDLDLRERPPSIELIPASGRYRFHSRHRHRDGHTIEVEVTIHGAKAGRDHDRFFLFIHDMTERRQLEDQFHQAQKMEAVGRLAGGVAHDFNNLLTAIAGYSELLLRNLGPDDPRRKDVAEIKRASDRAAGLTRQLLAFSRKQVLHPMFIDLNASIRELEKMLRRLIGEDITTIIELAPDLPPVRADPGQIEQVLLNLAINARDAMPEGGTLRISTASVELDDRTVRDFRGKVGRYATIEVSDTGVGMDAATRSHLFEPFFTTKDQGKGTGLGLATVYGIVSQSGGRIAVESELTRGARFRVYLPAAIAVEPPVPTRAAVAPNLSGNEVVLLVEDEAGVRELAARILREHGYRVLQASSGAEAVTLAASNAGPIHLLLTDVVMPQMSGRALAAELRRRMPGLEVVYMSGYTADTIAERGVVEGDDRVIAKPFTSDELARKVRDVLDRAGGAAAPRSA